MKNMTAATLLALCVSLSAVPTVMAQEQPVKEASKANRIDLRPKFKAGQSVRFKMSMKSGSEGETGQKMEQEIGLKLTTRSTDPEKGSTVEMEYESLKFKLVTGDTEIEFDSSKTSKDDPYDAMLRPLVGLKLTVSFDTDGNITSVTSDESAGGLSSLISGQFSGADVAKGVFGPISGLSKSDRRAAVGESWTNEDVISGGMGTTKIKTTNTLENVRGGKANIAIKGTVMLDGSGSTGLPLVNIKDSTIKGKAVWDVEGGMLESMQQEHTLMVEQPDLGIDMDPDAKPAPKKTKPTLTKHSMTVNVTRVK